MIIASLLQVEDPEHTFLTPEELADSLDVKLSRVTGWRKSGDGPKFVKLGKTVKYKVAAVDAWMDENTHQRIGDNPVRTARRSK